MTTDIDTRTELLSYEEMEEIRHGGASFLVTWERELLGLAPTPKSDAAERLQAAYFAAWDEAHMEAADRATPGDTLYGLDIPIWKREVPGFDLRVNRDPDDPELGTVVLTRLRDGATWKSAYAHLPSGAGPLSPVQ